MHPEPESTHTPATDAESPSPEQSAEQLSESPPATADPLAGVSVRVDPETIDEDGYVSLWNVAASTVKGNQELTRLLASKLLGFLCKHKCDFVFASSTDAKYLDEWFERDASLLYDWSPQSEKVDVLSQHAHVPARALVRLLEQKKFNPAANHNPRRADRVQWFTNQWCIG